MAEEKAKDFPMLYLKMPLRFQELRSKFTITLVAEPTYDHTLETTDATLTQGLSYETEVA